MLPRRRSAALMINSVMRHRVAAAPAVRDHLRSQSDSTRLEDNTSDETTNNHKGRYDDFFPYTSGRWLWNEEQQLQDRYRAFNVEALQRVAARCVGSTACISMLKLGEGSFNKVFRLQMNDNKTVIARVPNPNAGPAFFTTASEVATMDFVGSIHAFRLLDILIEKARNILDIPVPQVYEYSASSNNPVGAEYIIMEEAAGEPLDCAWLHLSAKAKLSIMHEIVSLEAKLTSISFSRHDSQCRWVSMLI